uniref:beta-ketoacyl synthase N-terminal-like domain-containing protein n=1 Tax=Trichloromonas sp. TaxID=3069249 RepID=UPI003D81A638
MKHGKSVAIVGVGGIFPMSPTLDLFWNTITGNVNTSRRPPEGRWLLEPDDVYDPKVGAADKVYSKQGCYIDDDAVLSLAGLDIDPDFVSTLDPMFRLLLHAGRQAFNDGSTRNLDRSRVGVIIGNLALPSEYSSAMARDTLGRTFEEELLGRSEPSPESDIAPLNRYVAGLPAGLLARSLGLGGTSFTLDAACASSLYAIKLAVDELAAGRADAMLTGGLSRPDALYTQMGFSQLHAVSPTGTCSPFDQKGDGLVVGEGCGMFLLKRTEDAVRAGDHIYAVIRGIGLSNDLGGSLLAPVSEGQLRAMRAAYAQAGWNPSDVDLVECHATGTPVGDAVEFASLKSLWGDSGWKRNQCVIGSVKSNIGHLLTAAGSAALAKVLLAMKEQTLPPTANFAQPAKGISFDDSPFRIINQPAPWNPRKKDVPRRAAVSAFGFGGINAHLLIEEWIPPQPSKSSVAFPPSFQRAAQPVAIVGMGAHFGPWSSLKEVQQRMLGADTDTAASLPKRWWGAEKSRWFTESGLNVDAFKGYFVSETAAVPGEFRIPPKELEEMLPRQLLMLQVADQALQDASIKGEDLLFTGVFIGTGLDLNATGYSFRWSIQALARKWANQLGRALSESELEQWIAELREAAGPALTANRVMGALGSIVASRVAKEFRIGGPSFTLSSEENSGLRALEIAIRALQEGSINRAIVGATDMSGDLRSVLGQHADRPFSASGQCRPFDRDADGTLIGEGAAALVLKRLEDAQQDGDRIYAVIKGIGTATGGRAEESVPAPQAIHTALQRAFNEGRIKPAAVSYLETHGSGIPDEDAVEASSLVDFIDSAPSDNPCWVGSVKAELGHTGSASGLASLIRAALCLHHQILPPLRHSRIDGSPWTGRRRPFLSPAAPQYWLRNRADGPRRALVSALGVDGSCSVALLEGHEDKGKSRALPIQRPLGALREGLFALEGDTASNILEQIARLQKLAKEKPLTDIERLARTWLAAAPTDPARARCLSLVAANRDDLQSLLEHGRRWLLEHPEKRLDGNGGSPLPAGIRDRIFYTPEPLAGQGETAFIFPGSGNHFAGMGRDLSARWPEIYRSQDVRSLHLGLQYLPQKFWGETLNEAVHDNHNALVIAQVALGTAVSDLVRSFGIEPQAVSGYSLGESAGLFSFGAWKDRDGMSRRLRDSNLFTDQLAGVCKAARQTWKLDPNEPVDWTLGLVAAPADKVRKALAGLPRVYLLIVNTYEECVIGGNRPQLEKLVSRLGCPYIPLRGVTTVHCEVADRVAQPYRELHRFPTTPPEDIRFYSCALGHSYELDENSVADAILGQALDTIDYTRVIEQMYADGVRIFLEMGPGNSCSRMIGRILKDRPHLARAACYPGQDAVSLLLRLLAQGLSERLPVKLAALYSDELLAGKEKSGPRIQTVIGGAPFTPPKPKSVVAQSAPRPAAAAQPMPVMTAPVPATAAVVPPPRPAARPAAAVATASASDHPLLKQLEESAAFSARSHEAFLRFSGSMTEALSQNINLQINLLQQMLASGQSLPADWQLPPMPELASQAQNQAVLQSPQATTAPQFDRDMCMEFAIGSIAKMLGPEFAEVDSYPTRVRLPDEPLMLVDRILTVEGEPRSMSHGRVVTEHDVTADRWYLDGGRIPTCVAVEAGQADLFLSGYLGIDFISKGKAVYRLLDAVVTFHRPLPVVGDVIHYDIKIERFFR